MSDKQDEVRERVREGYAQIAKAGVFSLAPTDGKEESCCGSGGCCGPSTLDVNELVKSIGYSNAELSEASQSANMGLSCGNPTAIASLKPGEVVLDLGSGGGFDAFIAGPKVGPTGRVIGVDMTPEMISRARKDRATYTKHSGLDNVEFRLGEIEHLPVADQSIDVVISNCVLNLSPAKPQVWKEIGRVLRPGGRVAISDLALLKPLPESVQKSIEALVGCIAGAVLVPEIEELAKSAGLVEIQLTAKSSYVDAMSEWKDPLYQALIEALPKGAKLSEYITSLDISARKP